MEKTAFALIFCEEKFIISRPFVPEQKMINNNNASPTPNPFSSGSDLFGMGAFDSVGKHNNFSAGFSGFSIDELDPLKN
jgi:hypothetical protein